MGRGGFGHEYEHEHGGRRGGREFGFGMFFFDFRGGNRGGKLLTLGLGIDPASGGGGAGAGAAGGAAVVQVSVSSSSLVAESRTVSFHLKIPKGCWLQNHASTRSTQLPNSGSATETRTATLRDRACAT